MQLQELRQVAAQRSWNITREYVDHAISGCARSRPALDEMLADARAGRFDILAVWKIDRLGRSLQHLLQILDELTGLGVDFVSVTDAGMDSTSHQGRLMLSIIGAFAEYERQIIRERVLSGIAKAQSDGIHCGRPAMDIDIRPALALLEKGHGLKSIAKMLNISRATLRRRLEDAGEWPRKRVSKTPSSKSPEKGVQK